MQGREWAASGRGGRARRDWQEQSSRAELADKSAGAVCGCGNMHRKTETEEAHRLGPQSLYRPC